MTAKLHALLHAAERLTGVRTEDFPSFERLLPRHGLLSTVSTTDGRMKVDRCDVQSGP